MSTKLTTQDLAHAFGVTTMTINNWRKGSPTRSRLPFTVRGRAVTFTAARTESWARKEGVALVNALEPREPAKLGRKPAARAE